MVVKKAGCILIDIDKKEIGLVYREKYNEISFPKGHLEDDETLEQCAVRETEEETGRVCVIKKENKLPVLKYRSSNDEDVELHFYIGIDIAKTDKTFDKSLVHELIWVPKEDVKKKLTYENLREYWNKIEPIISKVLNIKN